jgi:hypothetical protein
MMLVFVTCVALVAWAVWSIVSGAPQVRHAAVAALLFAIGLCVRALSSGEQREGFAPAMRVCTTGTADEGECEPAADPPDVSALPLRPCAMYFTGNVDACDAGLYEKSKLELLDMRSAYEKDAASHATQIQQLNRVIGDYDTIYRRQCKLTFSDWVRPDHPSYPMLEINEKELTARGNSRHWAFCFAPTADEPAKKQLEDALAVNNAANGETVMPSSLDEGYELSNGLATNTRLEFTTMAKSDLVRTFCTMFSPQANTALTPFYQAFGAPGGGRFFAIDMTNDGILRALRLYTWANGTLTRVPEAQQETVDSLQDDVARRPAYAALPQTPDRFVLESAYHCDAPALRVTQSTYVTEMHRLFGDAVVGSQLMYQLRSAANMYVFHINTCERVDSVVPKTITNLMAFLGNAIPPGILLLGNANSLAAELATAKAAAHGRACASAAAATDIYAQLAEVRRKQQQLAQDYVDHSRPNSGDAVNMAPKTQATRPTFASLRDDETRLQAEFARQVATKTSAQAAIDGLNLQLATIEQNKRNAVQSLRAAIVGKAIAVRDKPYEYISNDGNVYFQMPPEPHT